MVRHVLEARFSMSDLAEPVIAQVRGYCLAGGTGLATACDVVYVADDAQIGWPPVAADEPARHAVSSLDGRHATRDGVMLTGDCHVRARGRQWGVTDTSVPPAELERRTLDFAERAAKCRWNCNSSTSDRCTGRWRSSARAHRYAPAPRSRRLRSRPRQSWRCLSPFRATEPACIPNSTSAMRGSEIPGRRSCGRAGSA